MLQPITEYVNEQLTYVVFLNRKYPDACCLHIGIFLNRKYPDETFLNTAVETLWNRKYPVSIVIVEVFPKLNQPEHVSRHIPLLNLKYPVSIVLLTGILLKTNQPEDRCFWAAMFLKSNHPAPCCLNEAILLNLK